MLHVLSTLGKRFGALSAVTSAVVPWTTGPVAVDGIIDTNTYTVGQATKHSINHTSQTIWYGSGDVRYVAGVDFGPHNFPYTGPSHKLRVFKSTDKGATWAVQNDASSPLTITAASNDFYTLHTNQAYGAVQIGSKIYFVHADPQSLDTGAGHPYKSSLCVDVFDTFTDTWGAQVAGGPQQYEVVNFAAFRNPICVTSLTTGELVILYRGPNDTVSGEVHDRAYCVTFNTITGAWGVATRVGGTTIQRYSCQPQAAIVNGSDAVLLVYNGYHTNNTYNPTGNSTFSAMFGRMLIAGSLGTEQTIATDATYVIDPYHNVVGGGKFIANEFLLPYYKGNASPSLITWAVARGTNANPPVWTPQTIQPAPSNGVDNIVACLDLALWRDGSTLTAFMLRSQATAAADVLEYSQYVSGAWSAPTQILSINGSGFAMGGLHAAHDAAKGVVSLHWARQSSSYPGGNNDFFPTWYWEAGLGVVPIPGLAIAGPAPGDGTELTFYIQCIGYSGGTGTVTWAVIAGSLPPGLTLDPLTGCISGTPSIGASTAGTGGSGSYTITVQATDSLGSVTQPYTFTIHPPMGPAWVVPPTAQNGFVVVTDDTSPQEGSNILCRDANPNSSGGKVYNSPPLEVTPGDIYYLEAYGRADSGTDGTLSIGLDYFDSSGTLISSTTITLSGVPLVFTRFSGTSTVPAGAVTASFFIQITGNTTGRWCIDALLAIRLDSHWELSSIKSYYTPFIHYR